VFRYSEAGDPKAKPIPKRNALARVDAALPEFVYDPLLSSIHETAKA
jgi:hypothetical protein